MFKEIETKQKQWRALKPLPETIQKSNREQLLLEWTYHSNALAGCSFDLRETKLALGGIMLGGKTLGENQAVMNHRKAIELLWQWIETDVELSEQCIQQLYGCLNKSTGRRMATAYRKRDCVQEFHDLIPMESHEVPAAMDALMYQFRKDNKNKRSHPIQRAALFHCEFLAISPFQNKNGIMARWLINYELLRHDYLPVIVSSKDKSTYAQLVLEAVKSKQADLFADYIAELEMQQLQREIKKLQQLRQGFF